MPLGLSLSRPDGTSFVERFDVLPHEEDGVALNLTYVERRIKFQLWQKGASRIFIGGDDRIAEAIAAQYCAAGPRAFDSDLVGNQVYGEPLSVASCALDDLPSPTSHREPLGGHLDGCRIGFDLGGSDRKCAALIDGDVVFSEEVAWAPYFEEDPDYHASGIRDSVQRAADHLPRVDAIGGSAAGIYVDNEVRAASLFRGVPGDVFVRRVRPLFKDLNGEWNDVPFRVINDGDVSALAGSMSLQANGVLGIAMGTSMAAGYCDMQGRITSWINELAFAPVDYRPEAPVDEWSHDAGCGVQYFSQQAVARLAPAAGIEVANGTPAPEILEQVQAMMAADAPGARRIYETIGIYLGYALASYSEFYEMRHVILMGRVTTGEGGQIIIDQARRVLQAEFPGIAGSITVPDEKMKRHGQAVAAASLPRLAPAESPAPGAAFAECARAGGPKPADIR